MDHSRRVTESTPEMFWLYDVSLAIGTSLDVYTNCDGVLQALVARAPLQCAAVWIHKQYLAAHECAGGAMLICAIPSAGVQMKQIPPEHSLFTRLAVDDFITGDAARRITASLFTDTDVADAVPIIAPLGDLGTLAMVARRPFTRQELFGLRRLLGAFTSSIEACLEYQRETARRVRLEKALALVRAQADQGTWSRPAFLAGLGHEIRTPMNGIIGMSELLLRTGLDAEQQEFASTIRDEAQVLLHVINSTLELAELEARDLRVHATEFNLRDLITAVSDIVAPKAESRNVTVRTHVDAGLPDRLRGDVQLLRRILLELVENAIMNTEDGDVHLRADAYTSAEQHLAVRFEVQDDGKGILTVREGEDVRANEGFAIGLVIARRLVALLGGTIGAESNEENGTTFWFTLPLESAPAQRN